MSGYQWPLGVKRGRGPPFESEKFAKNQEKEGENREKAGKKRKNQVGSFTLPLLTDRAGYATAG